MTASAADEGRCAIDLLILRLAETPGEAVLRACVDVLNAEERRAAERYRAPSRRAQAIVSRAVLRTGLSQRLGRGPETWRIETSPRGRPRLASGQGVDDVDFNVSHTEGCIACAIARNARVGVDVEARSRLPDIKEVALRFLSPCETRAVSRMANGPAETALLRLWTLKEALAKGIGVGMALDFRAIDLPADGHNDGSRFTSPSAKRWAFRTFGNYPMHVVAIAYRAPQECDVAVTYQTAVRAIGGSIS